MRLAALKLKAKQFLSSGWPGTSFLFFIPLLAICDAPLAPCDKDVGASQFDEFVLVKVNPQYPVQSINEKRTGIVVAHVCVLPGSDTISVVKILIAPDRAMAISVTKALSQWKVGRFWGSQGQSHPFSYSARVIFYFVQEGDQWNVHPTSDSFYVGPDFAIKEQKLNFNPGAAMAAPVHKNKRPVVY
jgi:hypothetical protein